MPDCCVTYHVCCKTESDSGLPFTCSCETKITLREARSRVREGSARWKLTRNVNGGRLIDDKSAIVEERGDEPCRWRPRKSGESGDDTRVWQLCRD